MKITIAIYENKEISKFIYVDESKKEWDTEDKQFISVFPYSSVNEWIKSYNPHIMDSLTLEVNCHLNELSVVYLTNTFPELLL